LQIVETIERNVAAFRVPDLNLDTSAATGRMMLTMLGAIAHFLREMMLERHREGIAKAKAAWQVQGQGSHRPCQSCPDPSPTSCGRGTERDRPPSQHWRVYRVLAEAAG